VNWGLNSRKNGKIILFMPKGDKTNRTRRKCGKSGQIEDAEIINQYPYIVYNNMAKDTISIKDSKSMNNHGYINKLVISF